MNHEVDDYTHKYAQQNLHSVILIYQLRISLNRYTRNAMVLYSLQVLKLKQLL